jgi:hypothetical protein
MNRFPAIAFALVISVAAIASAQQHHAAEPIVHAVRHVDGSTFAKLVAQSRHARRVAPNASHDSGDDAFVFPLAGNSPGAFGTFYRTEATLVNNLGRDQDVAVYFFPLGGGTCSGVPVVDVTIPARSFRVWSDFVANVFNINGLGSLGVVAIDGSGNTDTSASIDGTLRIYTAAPGGGFASQSFDAAGLSTFSGSQIIFGLRHDGTAYRTNYGIFNYLDATRDFNVTFNGTTGASETDVVTVAPCSIAFKGAPGTDFGSLLIGIQPDDANGGWYAFASSNDNVSGDSWSVSARP